MNVTKNLIGFYMYLHNILCIFCFKNFPSVFLSHIESTVCMIYLLIFAKLIKSGLLVKFVILMMWSYFSSPTKEADILLFLGIKKKKKSFFLGGYAVSIMSNFFCTT